MGKFDKDSLGDRMKVYEAPYKQLLVQKMPIVIRVDGKAFHTFTKKMVKPFDDLLIDTMQKTMLALCKDVENCKFGYTQSDEITLVCVNNDVIKTEGLYKYKVNKILSVIASKTTRYFNKYFIENVERLKENPTHFKNVADVSIYEKKFFGAEFDARVMNIPEFDVVNNIIWRQQDATRNSIQMLGQANFSHKQLQEKNCSEIMDMLINEKGINWNDLETYKKRGSCCYRVQAQKKKPWKIDLDMPILTDPIARENLNKLLFGNVLNNPLLKV